MTWRGDYPEDFTTVTIPLTTHSSTGAPVAPSSAFETADFRIYKNGSPTEKATTNGLTIQSPHDTVTGLHFLIIDTSNDTGDSGFWVAGAVYDVVLVPDETVDAVAVTKVVGTFGIDMGNVLRPVTAGRKLEVDGSGNAATVLADGSISASTFNGFAITEDVLHLSAAQTIANTLLNLSDGVEVGLTPKNALRLAAATIGGKLSGAGTGTETLRNAVADSKSRVIWTVDSSGNRSAATYDFS
jgi:hypothetical protein